MKLFWQRIGLFIACCVAAMSGHAQTTQITASNIAAFGGATITGTFCVTPTDQNGNPVNLSTPSGQQFSPSVPLCFPIVNGVLSSSAIVPDTSQTQPVNACYLVTVYNTANIPVGTIPCIQPSGNNWSFDAYVPSTLPSIPALTLPQYQLNGTPLTLQTVINFSCPGCTNPSGGTVTIPAGGSMTYPGAGVANSTGTAWGTSYSVGTAANNLLQLNGSGALPPVSGANLTNLPPPAGGIAPASVTSPGIVTGLGMYRQTTSAGPYFEYADDFVSAANVASSSIGSPTAASCAIDTTHADINHIGQILLQSGTGASSTGITCGLQAEGANVVSPNSSASNWTWESAVLLGVLPGTTGETVQVGFTASPAVSPWTTGMQFYMNAGNLSPNNWYCRQGSTNTNSTIAAVAGAWTRLTMANDGTYVHWYVNGTEATACKIAVGSVPSGTQYPASWAITTNTSGTSVSLAVDYVVFQRNVTR